MLKKVKKKHRGQPKLEPKSIEKHIKVGDLRDLVIWLLVDSETVPPPKFVDITNKAGIQHVVSVMIPGLPREMFLDDSSISDPSPHPFETTKLQILNQVFSEAWPTYAPGSNKRLESTLAEFTSVPISRAEKKRAEAERKREESAAATETLSLDKLLVSDDLLKDLDYPINPQENWVTTKPMDREPAAFALDCEMCETADGKKSLTRISVVDMNENVVFTSFVKPDVAISNYLTPFSGVTAELLEGVTTTQKNVQNWILENISEQDILIGHSLDNDMRVLQLSHSRIIDTALCFTHPRGLPFRPALKSLASRLLGIEIQISEKGHDPAEDARTCVQLVKLKQKRGLSFGTHTINQSIATRLSLASRKTAVVACGTPRWGTRDAASILSCTTDEEVLTQTVKVCNTYDYVFATLSGLSRSVQQHGDTETAFKNLNENLTRFFNELPDKTAIIIWSGNGDTKEMLDMQQRQRNWLSEYRTKPYEDISDPWTDADNVRLSRATQNARLGVSFLKIICREETASTDVKDSPSVDDTEELWDHEPLPKKQRIEKG